MTWVFDDARPWGRKIAAAIKERGSEARLFTRENQPDRSPVVLIPRHKEPDRARHKHLAKQLHRRGMRLIPSFHERMLYDDKVKQLPVLRRFLPRTEYVTNPEDADFLVHDMAFPLFSKRSEGAGSNNVRFLKAADAARREIDHVLPAQGYLYWQEAVATDHDWRVLCFGQRYAWCKKRFNRPDRPMASGSGNSEQVTKLDTSCEGLLEFAYRVCAHANLNWAGLDIVPGWKVLEVTLAWGDHLDGAEVFERHGNNDWRPTGRKGGEFFPLVAEWLEDGVL